jgi:leader peptidase (prepilin peptidase) / N-methyltransferase
MRDYFHFLQDNFPLMLQLMAFYMGACTGSFLNVCILRIPLGKSIVTPRSHCACGKLIAWYDNIPIVSWFILRGRARCCGRHFSFRYPFIEAATAFTFLWLWLTLPPSSAIAGMVFFSLLLLGAMVDLDHMILPDVSTLGGLAVGVILSGMWPQIHGLPGGPWHWVVAKQGIKLALGGAIIGAGVLYWIGEIGGYFKRVPAMGYGDMLLMGCVGAFGGWAGTVASMFGGAVLGLFGIVLIKLVAAMKSAKQPTEPAAENADEPAAAAEPTPLGRRLFEVDYVPILAAVFGAWGWLWHTRNTAMGWPGAVFLGVIFLFAVRQRGAMVLHETWLLLAVIVAMILSGLWPQMQGLAQSNYVFIEPLLGLAGSAFGAVVGAGAALWLMELANLFWLNFMPPPPDEEPMADYNQIWGEAYLILFGAVGAFCGWRAALVAVAAFAVVGAVKSAIGFFGAKRPASVSSAPAPATTPAEVAPLTWSFGQEIPFGPWLALGGFLYYALPALHETLLPYFDVLRALALGELPGGN